MRRFASVQPRRCVLPTSARRIPEVGLSHTIGRSHDHGPRFLLRPFPWSVAPILRVPVAALGMFALLDPVNAQFWGDSWGGRQQPQQTPTVELRRCVA